jgi:adenine deaminase
VTEVSEDQEAALARLKAAMELRLLVDTLLAPDRYADLVLRGGTFINVVTRELYPADVAVARGRVLLVGDVRELIGPETEVEDIEGAYVAPGFIDGHMHFESSMLTVTEFVRLSIPTGTTTIIADPHEIGNVLGLAGMRAMIDEARGVPSTVRFAVPCRVPDVPGLETAGEVITAREIGPLLSDPVVQGIGELQGFSNIRPVYRHRPETVEDILAAVETALALGKTVEGNAPGLVGAELAAHILAGGGNISCHETTSKAEAIEKLRNGVYVLMREGSSQRDMPECIRAITEEGVDSRYAVLVSDDLVADDLIRHGHMNDIVRRTVRQGVDPVEAIQMATINPAQHFLLFDRGALTPGRRADIVVLDSLTELGVRQVYVAGVKAAEDGRLLLDLPRYRYPDFVRHSIRRGPVAPEELSLRAEGGKVRARALVLIPDENLTETAEALLPVVDGVPQPDLEQDVLPIAVVERHGRTGRVGRAFVKGLGLKRGAIAESVAHDTHNIIVSGASYDDMATAVNHVIAMGGGLALVAEGRVLGSLALPVGGLMTDELDGAAVAAELSHLTRLVQDEMGSPLHVPFMHLSFLSLATSPKWKVTDVGLIDVDRFEVLPVLI